MLYSLSVSSVVIQAMNFLFRKQPYFVVVHVFNDSINFFLFFFVRFVSLLFIVFCCARYWLVVGKHDHARLARIVVTNQCFTVCAWMNDYMKSMKIGFFLIVINSYCCYGSCQSGCDTYAFNKTTYAMESNGTTYAFTYAMESNASCSYALPVGGNETDTVYRIRSFQCVRPV